MAERLLQPFAAKTYLVAGQAGVAVEPRRLTLSERHRFARYELRDIFTRVWIWVLIGVGLGAALHGLVPEGWFEQHLGSGQWWSVPAAVVLGIPQYSHVTGVIPVMGSLTGKGPPIGTTLAFCTSTVAASVPVFILLKRVMQWRLLAILFLSLLAVFIRVGWICNLLASFIL